MATIIFDFDSTLITCESLEEIARSKADPGRMQQIQEITNQGMAGEIDFMTSLKKRMSLVALTQEDFIQFGKQAHCYLTLGMEELISDLQASGVEVWIISGALREVLMPLGRRLSIPEKRLIGIVMDWTPDGHFAGIDEALAINRSKWEGAQEIHADWAAPKIAVGDGATDFALFEHGLVDHFIAFTQNVRRPALLKKGIAEAASISALKSRLEALLNPLGN